MAAKTVGLSGPAPNETVSWGKIDPERLPASVVWLTGTYEKVLRKRAKSRKS
jgi:deoxyhypusine synthase